MGRSAFVALIAVVALASFAGFAAADRTGVYDAVGDSEDAFYDYVAAEARHASGGRLDHRVRTATKIKAANAGILEIDTNGDGKCEWAIAKFTFGEAAIHCRKDKTKQVDLVKIAPKVMSFRFSIRTIGSPRKYRWRFTNDGGSGTGDFVPSTGWVLHRLS